MEMWFWSRIGFNNKIIVNSFKIIFSTLSNSCTFAPVHNNHLNNIGMYLTKEKKAEIFAKYGKSAGDTGSAEGQIALFTFRINHLTGHLKQNKKDFNSERALVRLVGKRKRLLNYLRNKDIERYRAIIADLGLRR